MTRAWDAATSAALAASNVPLVSFIEMDFISGGVQSTLRLCTAAYDIVWNTYTWTGSGNLLSIAEISESTQVEALGMTVQMSAVSPALLALAYNATYQGRPFRLWVAPLTESYAFTTPRLVYAGYMDTMSIDDSNATLTLTVEHTLTRLNIPPMGRYSDEDQKLKYPTDRGLEYVAKYDNDMEIKWGRA